MIRVLALALSLAMPRPSVSSSAALASLPEGGAAAICGLPRSGKSRIAKAAADQLRRVVVFDPYGDRDRLESAHGHELYPWTGDLWSIRELALHPGALLPDPLRLVVTPRALDEHTLGQDFASLAELCWHAGNLDLVAEEASLYSRQAASAVLRLTSGGGHARVRLILITQSIGMLSIMAARHLTHVVALNQSDASDFKILAARCGKAFTRKVQAWTPGDRPNIWRLGAEREKPC